MAQVHWEMLATDDGSGGSVPLAVRKPFARQLRTTYSPAPTRLRRPGEEFRALDHRRPGRSRRGRRPAGRAKRGAEGEGDPRRASPASSSTRGSERRAIPREGSLQGVKPADRLEVLSLLLRGDYDLVHYAGHGDFDPEQPDRVGWLFAGGLLTPGEIARIERVPTVIVSNACLSGANVAGSRGRTRRRGDPERGRPPPQPRGRVLQARRPQLRRHRLGGERRRSGDLRAGVLRRAARGQVVRRSRARRPRGALARPRARTARSGPRTSTTATRRAIPGSGPEPERRQRGRRRPARPVFPLPPVRLARELPLGLRRDRCPSTSSRTAPSGATRTC